MAGFKINRVYTRTGDDGSTALVGGERVSKVDSRVVAFGDVDELNAHLGHVAVALSDKTKDLKPIIFKLQQELFNLGAELATPEPPFSHVCAEEQVKNLELLCDKFSEGLPELESFILPGGSELASRLHLARTVARRAERSTILLKEQMNPQILIYLNRLSDLLFVLCRWSLKVEGKAEILWEK